MATKKTTSTKTSTAKATTEKKGTKAMNLKEIPANTIIALKPHTPFLLTPHKNKIYINAEGHIKTEYEAIIINETLNIKRYTDNPVISNDYQTIWVTPDNDLIKIDIQPSATTAEGKTFSPITYFIKDLLSQLNCTTDIISLTPEQILEHLKYLKELQVPFQFIVTENISKKGNAYKILKPVKQTVIKTESNDFAI